MLSHLFHLFRLMNVLYFYIYAPATPPVLTQMVPISVNVWKGLRVTDSCVKVCYNLLHHNIEMYMYILS